MSTTGHESDIITVSGLQTSLQKLKTDHIDEKVSNVSFDSTTGKIQKVVDGTTTDVVQVYTKDQVNSLVSTPRQNYVTVEATSSTTSVTSLLPATGSTDTVYRVANWNGSQYDTTVYSEYAWNGSAYTKLDTKQVGIDTNPTHKSQKFVESGGIFNNINRLVDKSSNTITYSGSNHFISNDGSLGAIAGGLVKRIEVNAGEKYLIYLELGFTPNRLDYAFYNGGDLSASTFISGSDEVWQAHTFNGIVTVPTGAVCLALTVPNGSEGYLYRIENFNDAFDRIDSIEDDLLYIVDEKDNVVNEGTNSFVGPDGAYVSYSTNYYCKKLAVNAGEKYHIVLSAGVLYGKKLLDYAFYSGTPSASTFISGGLSYNDTHTFNGIVTVPTGAVYMVMSFSIGDNANGYTIDKLERINDKVHNNIVEIDSLKTRVTDVEEAIDNIHVETPINIDMSPVGVNDNYFLYLKDNIILQDYTFNRVTYFGICTKDSNDLYQQIDCDIVHPDDNSTAALTSLFCLKKQDNKYVHITFANGAVMSYKFSELTGNQTLYQRLGNGSLSNTVLGKVLYVDDDYVQFCVYGYMRGQSLTKSTRQILRVTNGYSYSSGDTLNPYELNEDLCGIFNTDCINEDELKPNTIYRSRAEKLGSNLIGKNVICFGDSLSGYMKYLLLDWGVRVYKFGIGGGRMGYEANKEDTWICNNASIVNFQNDTNKPSDIDFIINMDGTNESFVEIDATELNYVYNNKNWFDKDLETDPWSSLSAANKLRFTGTACYIVAFYSLAQLYPKAQAVVVIPFYNRTSTSGYQDGKWKSISDFSSILVSNTSYDTRENMLRTIAHKLNAILVENNTRVGFLNAPACITDGTHPKALGLMSKAWTIAQAINFPADIDSYMF